MRAQLSDFLRTSGKWLLGFSPLLLALTFYALFRLFHGQLNLEAITWIGSDNKAITAAAEVETAENAVEKAKEHFDGLQAADPTLGTAQARLVEARTFRDQVRTAAKLPASATATELSLRVCWGVACVMFTFLMVLVVIQSIREIDDVNDRSSSRPPGPPPARPLWLVCLPVLALGTWVGLTMRDAGETVSKLGGTPATLLFDTLQGTNCSPLAPEVAELAKIPQLGWLLNCMNRGALIAIVLVAGAVTAVVWHMHARLRTILEASTAPDEPTLQEHARWLRVTMNRAVTLMQLTAITLIVGVIEVLLLYLLTSYHVRPTLQTDVRLVAQVFTLAGGLFYSGLLIAVYLPLYDAIKSLNAELTLRFKAQASPAPVGQNAQSPTSTGFDISPIPVLKSLLTLLSPLLAALGSALFSDLSKILADRM